MIPHLSVVQNRFYAGTEFSPLLGNSLKLLNEGDVVFYTGESAIVEYEISIGMIKKKTRFQILTKFGLLWTFMKLEN